MTVRTILGEHIDHNYWARDRQLQACAALSQEQFLQVRDTLAHMVAAEWIWLERWRGRSPRSLMAAEEFPTLAAIAERWSAVEGELRAFVDGLRDEDLERPFTYVNGKGETWTYPLYRAIFHVLSHQSYHRGQVTNGLRLLGVEAPSVDFLVAYDMEFRR
ncbi:MAG TPA: DinB family protein [Bryobacteraceae bacterium]|nr:DinB family protein [Bryobacteraceae bacterium]